MKILLFLLLSVQLFASDVEIKTLRTFKSDSQISFPIINYTDKYPGKIVVDFDVDAEEEPFLNIVFKYCDKDWLPYNNMFLSNTGKNIDYNISLDLLPNLVKGANYHFNKTYPTNDITFPYSGKWIYNITDSYDTSIVYGTGRFIVVHPALKLNAGIERSRLENESYSSSTRSFKIDTYFTLPESLYNTNVDQIEIIENQKIYDSYVLKKDEYNESRYYSWDGADKFNFVIKDIVPGNEYRQTDFRNKNRFSTKKINANIDGIETVRGSYSHKKDLNGGSVLTRYDDENSDYLDVTFRLRMPYKYRKKIFVVGSFSEWDLFYENELIGKDDLFEKTIKLKRGKYDYQYVSADGDGNTLNNIDWIEIEGNDWETENDYHILLYYTEPDFGGYDRLIGYLKISSGGL